MLTLKRDSGYADKLRDYKIIVDGNVIGTIADGESKSVDVSPGEHIMYLKIDYIKSNSISFKYAEKDNLDFICRSNLRGGRYFLLPIYLTLLKNKYIVLQDIR